MQVYRPGETISGAVEFTLTEPKRYDCIKIDFLGGAHVKWSEGKTHFVGNDKYAQSSLLLWSPQQSNGGSIGPGSFSLPFQFVIPSHVPSSFGNPGIAIFGEIAYIFYKLEARAVTGAMRLNHKASAPITVSRPTSISGTNEVKPVREVERKQVGCLCCAAGDVEFVAKLPRTGFCVTNGDVIPLTVDVQNNCTRVIQMRARIFRRVTMIVRGHENSSRTDMAEISSQPIQAGASYVWNPTNWIVPELSPTLHGCRLLRVEYVLEVCAVIPNAVNLRCHIPIVLGNLPFSAAENFENFLLDSLVASLILGRTSESAVVRRDNEEEDADDECNSSERATLI